jgi:Secretion system C-terminal sorting domain
MKKICSLLTICLFTISAFAQTSGGPDAYGYIWKNSNDPQGPAYNWIDITTVGTQVTGLTDDNSVAFVPMGANFHYYWSDYNQIKIGSNGWLSFDNISNIAHCFPVVPSVGGVGNNILAPFMTDLIFNAAGSTPEVWYYYDATGQQFIVSFVNSPWWQAAAPGYIGNNTFQVILSEVDSSITFQYQQVDAANFNDIAGCTQDLEIGIENLTGNIGLEVHNDALGLPSNNMAIKFYYPDPVTFSVKDITPEWSQNLGNEAQFYDAAATIVIPTSINNAGNADVVTSINVNITVTDVNLLQFYTADSTINSLNAGASQVINFDFGLFGVAGQYNVTITTTNGNDINPTNNTLTTEIEVVDLSASPMQMGYATPLGATGSLNWTGGGGAGIHIIPPTYPVTLDSVQIFIVPANSTGFPEEYLVEIFADDGANNSPGTLLTSETIAQGTYATNADVMTVLSSPVLISSGGIHIGWSTVDSVAIGSETNGPISQRTYEFVGGSWAPYRLKNAEDFLITGFFSGLPTSISSTKDVLLNDIKVYPNPAKDVVYINGLLDVTTIENKDIKIVDVLGKVVHTTKITTNNHAVNISNFNKGLYFIVLDGGKSTYKFVKE